MIMGIIISTLVVGILTIIALIIGPARAVKISNNQIFAREAKERKEKIFRTLMAFRGLAVSVDFVTNFNLVPIEFNDNQEIVNLWQKCLNHLNTDPINDKNWQNVRRDNLSQLLCKIAGYLNYTNLDYNTILNMAYLPKCHSDNQEASTLFIELLKGNRELKIKINNN
jgi:hypothetical protein